MNIFFNKFFKFQNFFSKTKETKSANVNVQECPTITLWDAYEKFPCIKNSIQLYVNIIAQGEIKIQNGKSDVFAEMLQNPNKDTQTSFNNLIEAFVKNLYCEGRVFVLYQNPDSKLTLSCPVVILNPTYFTNIEIVNGEEVEYKHSRDNGVDIIFKKQDDYFYNKEFGKLFVYKNNISNEKNPIPDLLKVDIYIQEYNRNLIFIKDIAKQISYNKNILTPTSDLTNEQRDDLVESILSKASSSIIIAPYQLNVTRLDNENKAYAELLLRQDVLEKKIINYLGVPPEKSGEVAKFNNKEIANIEFIEEKAYALKSIIQREFERQYRSLTENKKGKLEINLDKIKTIQEYKTLQMTKKATDLLKCFEKGILTKDEYRKITGIDEYLKQK